MVTPQNDKSVELFRSLLGAGKMGDDPSTARRGVRSWVALLQRIARRL